MILISRFFLCPNIPYFLWTVYVVDTHKKQSGCILFRLISGFVNLQKWCPPRLHLGEHHYFRVDKILMLTSKKCINCIMALILIGSTSRHFNRISMTYRFKIISKKNNNKKTNKPLTIRISIFFATMMKTCWGHLFKISPCKTFLEHYWPAKKGLDKRVDPDQTASEEAVWWGSSLFATLTRNLWIPALKLKPTFYLRTEREKLSKF